jgi:hypothetical protein
MIQQQVLFPGALKITLLPAGAVSAGAQWRRVGTTAWLASGALESGLMPGQYAIEFKDTAGWKRPADAQVTVTAGQTALATRTYQDPRSGIAASGWTIY